MIVNLLLVALGLVILLLAGDSLVKGAVNLALRAGIPALIVSLTIVAFGTSAPELLVSIKAVLDGAPGLALGNVVGSNIANVLLVLGVPALFFGLSTRDCDSRDSFIQMMVATVLFVTLAALFGGFGWVQGVILLAGLAFMLAHAFRESMRHRRAGQAVEGDELDEVEGADPDLAGWKIGLFLVIGLVGLPIGANLLVENATEIARVLGVSETVIGLTLVAVGTSLPELATTVMAAYRRQTDVVLGNVIGSNMFNLLGIIGVAAFVGRIPVDPLMLRFDMVVMFASSLLLAPFVFKGWYMGRVWGTALVALYALYTVMVIL
ncbi:calcium/sodium antiporter [Maritimibacter sp. DP1N21-5]|uniref:calcium/sodium antiporter n=1 Tax=Maritimibacter sp. DP1N21-5 TaxID=2836867 RepID=UPI001C439D89|nr:calcium/sodium antiporter [Maritimibacter sp. DP1N21-5]MBV7407604.1 calcium/sodium antiporter [Maritimibacter sp. DP1N21-5]